jgi:hypothetical protein
MLNVQSRDDGSCKYREKTNSWTDDETNNELKQNNLINSVYMYSSNYLCQFICEKGSEL